MNKDRFTMHKDQSVLRKTVILNQALHWNYLGRFKLLPIPGPHLERLIYLVWCEPQYHFKNSPSDSNMWIRLRTTILRVSLLYLFRAFQEQLISHIHLKFFFKWRRFKSYLVFNDQQPITLITSGHTFEFRSLSSTT